ncbi:MAG TPA: site-2 protease family protein, partial [Myxococcota bacterium]|nr:site-2 protease family protein [Myxococcota bacterium]
MSLPGTRTRYDRQLLSLAGIPIRLSPWYLALVWLSLSRAPSLAYGLVTLAALTLSVLVHELGHGLAASAYDLRPSILLHGLGGWCEHAPARSRNDDLVVVAAGPAFGLALGAAAWAAPDVGPWWIAALRADLAWLGLFWSLVNLLPVLPLDGGSILLNVLERRRSIRSPVRVTRTAGVAASIGAVAWGLGHGEIGVALMFALLGWDNAAALGRVRGLQGLSFNGPAAPTAGP